MSYAPPVHSDSALYTGSPFNTNLNASPGVLVLGGKASAPAGTLAKSLGMDADGTLVEGSPGGGGAGVDPVERLLANPNTVAAGNPVAAACDFEGACDFITSTDQAPTGPFVRAGRRIDLYDPSTPASQGVVQYSNLTRGQGGGAPGLRAGLSLYAGLASNRTLSVHLTSESQNKPVCEFTRTNDETDMILKGFAMNDVSILTVKATNDFTAVPPVDHCVIRMTSQTADPVGGLPATGVNTCSLKYTPVSQVTTAGTLSIDRDVRVGNTADTTSFNTLSVDGLTDSTPGGARFIVGAVGSIPEVPGNASDSDGSGRIFGTPGYISGTTQGNVANWIKVDGNGDPTTGETGRWELMRSSTIVEQSLGLTGNHVVEGDNEHSGSMLLTGTTIKAKGTAPSSATDIGTEGEIRWDTGGGGNTYLYLCIATDTWVRERMSTW